MTESNNVKFVEAEGKWLWKRYDENGSVIYRSPLFNTEREARGDYDINGHKQNDADEINQEAKDIQVENTAPDRSIIGDTTINPPEDENTPGTATLDEGQERQSEDNGVGQATI
jgi:hypothetical protein